MKKLFISALALAAFTACSQDEIVEKQSYQAAIGFAGNYVNNVPRAAADPSTTTQSLEAFDVWAFMDEPAGIVLEGEKVTKVAENEWTYSNVQYWTPGHTYYFSAMAPVENKNWTLNTDAANAYGAGIVNFINVDGSEDLLYAATSVSTEEMNIGDDMAPVKFEFNHLLSKVKFTFKNGFTTDNAYIKVDNVKMTAPAAGSINLAVENWWDGDDWNLTNDVRTLAFGDVEKLAMGKSAEVTNERLTIPANEEYLYEITFDVTLYMGTVEAYKVSKVSTITGEALEMGKAYNFTAEINPTNLELAPIEFEVIKVKEWDTKTEDVEFLPSTPVATAQELVAAVEDGLNVTLTEDINLDQVTARAAKDAGLVINKDIVIDGNGHSLTTSAVRAIQIIDAKNITIKNLTLNAGGERGIQLQSEGQTLIVENVTAVSKNYTLHITQTCKNANVTVSNSNLKGLNTVNVWAENSKIEVNNCILTCEDNAEEGYAVVYNAGENTSVTVNGGEVVITGTNSEGTHAGLLLTNTSSIKFDGTKGDCAIEGHTCVINYGQYRYSFATLAEAYETAKDGETIVLIDDVTIESQLQVYKKITLDLNGNTLTAAKEGAEIDAIWVRDNAELVITGNGTINASYDCVFATGTSKVIIENGTFNSAAEAVFAQSNATVEILGGTFKSSEYPKYTLNLKDGSNATITVKGGTYYNFNPAESLSENPQINFVATGYNVTEADGWYTVVAK